MNRINSLIFTFSLFLTCCWWEEPQEAGALDVFTTQANFLVTPDTSDVKVNDTIWLSYEAASVFTAPTGKTKTVSNINTTMPIWIYKINTGSLWERATVFDCSYVPVTGTYSNITTVNSIGYISSVYSNGKYNFKIGFVPHVADTFFIEVKSSIDQRKGEAFSINASFSGTKQNLDFITPHGYWENSPSTRAGLYSFVAH